MKVLLFFWNWFVQIWVGLDCLANAFLFGSGKETISARMGRHHHRCKFCQYACRLLDRITFSDNHCRAKRNDDDNDFMGMGT